SRGRPNLIAMLVSGRLFSRSGAGPLPARTHDTWTPACASRGAGRWCRTNRKIARRRLAAIVNEIAPPGQVVSRPIATERHFWENMMSGGADGFDASSNGRVAGLGPMVRRNVRRPHPAPCVLSHSFLFSPDVPPDGLLGLCRSAKQI